MRRQLINIAILMSLLLVPVLSHAGTTCAAATQLSADGGKFDFDFVAANSTNNYAFAAVAGRSYSVEVRQDYDDVNTDLTVTIQAGACPGAAIAGITHTESVEPQIANNVVRESFIAAANTTVQIAVTSCPACVNGRYIAIKVSDTTLFNPGWSTFGGFNGFYAIMNTTSSPVSGTLTFFNGSTGAVTKSVAVNLTAVGTAGAIASVNTQSLGVAANQFGYATFAYTGPPGAVTINTSIANFSVNAIQPGQFLPARQ